MAAGNVFNVAFGFNETELTSLLEDRHYLEAEQIIKASAHTSFLDEGCYQRTPLFIPLCGTNRCGKRTERNFYISKVLVQHGACPNFRVPETNMGLYTNPGKSPFELLVELYIAAFGNRITWNGSVNRISRDLFPVIGLNNKYINCGSQQLKDDIMELAVIFLSHGGDCNIKNEVGHTLLHRAILDAGSTDLPQFLCSSGANINAKDLFNSTPLMLCCRTKNPEMVKYLLECEGVEVDAQNRSGHTALSHSMKSGDWVSAQVLLQAGCETRPKATNYSRNLDEPGKPVSALFMGCMCVHIQKQFRNDYLIRRQHSTLGRNFLFQRSLVDSGNFDHKEILAEIHEFIDAYIPKFSRLKSLGIEIIRLIFGNTSCTLRQMCARQIFIAWVRNEWPCFVRNSSELEFKLPPDYDGNVLLISQHASSTEELPVATVSVPDGLAEITLSEQNRNSMRNSLPLQCIPEDSDDEQSEEDFESAGCPSITQSAETSIFEDTEDSVNDKEKLLNELAEVNIDFTRILQHIRSLSLQDFEAFLTRLNIPQDTTVCYEVELLRMVLLCYFGSLLTPSDADNMNCSYDHLRTSDSEDESDIEYW